MLIQKHTVILFNSVMLLVIFSFLSLSLIVISFLI